jgi:hypothetical protein
VKLDNCDFKFFSEAFPEFIIKGVTPKIVSDGVQMMPDVTGVARFFLAQLTKTGGKYTKRSQNIIDDHRIYQLLIKYTK